jgi:hypothetical protein
MFFVFLLLDAVYIFWLFFSSFLFLGSSHSCHSYTGEPREPGEPNESNDLNGFFNANVVETKKE